MKDGLGMNETLENLELNRVHNSDLWGRAFSFLRTNKALKSLVIILGYGVEESCLSAFCIGIAGMLQDNTSLESLIIQKCVNEIKIKAEEYIALVTALQHNTALKSLSLNRSDYCNKRLTLTHDEGKQMASLPKKNYALESLPGINLKKQARRDVEAILRLNAAGRRYLAQDGSSISKGVQVLSAVSNEIDCVFLHLLENPRLCDRSAVELMSDGTDNGGSTSPVHHSIGN
jgi:hypothetical protein